MYIKKVTKTNKKSGKTYTYLHLVENIRTPQGPRQHLILNLGKIDLPVDKYKELANTIESILSGQGSLFSAEADVYQHAQHAAKRIKNKKSTEKALTTANPALCPPASVEIKEVDVNSLIASECRSIGPEYVCHHFWKRLKIDQCLLDAGMSAETLPVVESLVLGRLISPGSERHTHYWADNVSGLYELCGFPIRYSQRSFYRAAHNLYLCKDRLESFLNKREVDLFSLSETMCFFDLTNTFLEGKAKKKPKAKRGRSKEKRSDCKLLTLALIVDENGFAKYSRLFPGNQFEADTLESVLDEMKKHNPSIADDKTVVMDAGIATEKNIAYLQENNYHYIVVNKSQSPFKTNDAEDFRTIKEDVEKEIKIEVSRKSQNGETFLLCKSLAREKKEHSIRQRQEDLFIQSLQQLKTGLSKKGCTKKYTRILEGIGRLRQKYPKASKVYSVEVLYQGDKKNSNATDIIWQKQDSSSDAMHCDGHYVLRTDRHDLTDKQIWETYTMLTRIENAFRCMKSSLGLRPVFHQLEDSADAHMFISVVAYHIMHAIEYSLKQKGDRRSWDTIRTILSTHQVVTIEYDTYSKKGKQKRIHLRKCTRSEATHCEIYENLNLSHLPMKSRIYENV